MATGFTTLFERSGEGVLARLPREERERMARNAAAAAARLKARGKFTTEVENIRRGTRDEERISA